MISDETIIAHVIIRTAHRGTFVVWLVRQRTVVFQTTSKTTIFAAHFSVRPCTKHDTKYLLAPVPERILILFPLIEFVKIEKR
eukprot:UN01090